MNKVENKSYEELFDPVTFKPLYDAVSLVQCGHTLNHDTVFQLQRRECPTCRAKIQNTIPNYTVRKFVVDQLGTEVKRVEQKAQEILQPSSPGEWMRQYAHYLGPRNSILQAILSNNSQLFKMVWDLLDLNEKVRIVDTEMIALASGRRQFFEEFIRCGIDVKMKNRNGETALHFWPAFSHCVVLDKLIEVGLDVNARDSLGNTPLHLLVDSFLPTCEDYCGDMCLIKYDLEKIQQLIQRGADPTITNNVGKTPYDIAMEKYRRPGNGYVCSEFKKVIKFLNPGWSCSIQ